MPFARPSAARPFAGLLATTALALAALILAGCGDRPETPVDASPVPEASRADRGETAPLPTPLMPDDAPPQEEIPLAPGASCTDAIGEARAAQLVQRCIAVSPATHPPCNVANPCAVIQAEIDRSCALWDRDGDPPAECRG